MPGFLRKRSRSGVVLFEQSRRSARGPCAAPLRISRSTEPDGLSESSGSSSLLVLTAVTVIFVVVPYFNRWISHDTKKSRLSNELRIAARSGSEQCAIGLDHSLQSGSPHAVVDDKPAVCAAMYVIPRSQSLLKPHHAVLVSALRNHEPSLNCER